MTPEHLGVPESCRNEMVLALAQQELSKMGQHRAPVDKICCIVRVCPKPLRPPTHTPAPRVHRAAASHRGTCACACSQPNPEAVRHRERRATPRTPRCAPVTPTSHPRAAALRTQACSVIFNVLNLSRAKGGGTGADDFLPAFIYMVLRAEVDELWSNIEFVRKFRNPADLMSKAGYCFVNLRSAVAFFENISHEALSLEEEEFGRLMADAERRVANEEAGDSFLDN